MDIYTFPIDLLASFLNKFIILVLLFNIYGLLIDKIGLPSIFIYLSEIRYFVILFIKGLIIYISNNLCLHFSIIIKNESLPCVKIYPLFFFDNYLTKLIIL